MVLADRPTTSRWTPCTGRTLLSGQADPRRQEPRPTLRPQDTLRRSQSHSESDLGSAFDPKRTVARAGTEESTPGSLFSARRRGPHDRVGDRVIVRGRGVARLLPSEGDRTHSTPTTRRSAAIWSRLMGSPRVRRSVAMGIRHRTRRQQPGRTRSSAPTGRPLSHMGCPYIFRTHWAWVLAVIATPAQMEGLCRSSVPGA